MKGKMIVLSVILLVCGISVQAQTRVAQPQKGMSLFGVQFGCTKTEFYNQLNANEDYKNFANLLGDNVLKSSVSTAYYVAQKEDDIIYQATVIVAVGYDFHLSGVYNKLQLILCAKYGGFENGYNEDRTPCLYWSLPYGQIVMWRNNKTEVHIQYTDYNVLKKLYAKLYNAL